MVNKINEYNKVLFHVLAAITVISFLSSIAYKASIEHLIEPLEFKYFNQNHYKLSFQINFPYLRHFNMIL